MDDMMMRMMELKHKGYYCSQIMMKMVLDTQDKDDSDLIRSMAGLAFGAGIGEICGALTGAACILSLYAGKGSDEEEENPRLMGMLQEIGDWFSENYSGKYGGIGCDVMTEDGALRNDRCGAIVSETYTKAIEILVANGFDPSEGR